MLKYGLSTAWLFLSTTLSPSLHSWRYYFVIVTIVVIVAITLIIPLILHYFKWCSVIILIIMIVQIDRLMNTVPNHTNIKTGFEWYFACENSKV